MKLHCLMVANPREYRQARDAGWDYRDIVGPNINQLEGRRYRSITITWEALTKVGESLDLQSILASNAVVSNGEVKIGTIEAPPVEDKELERTKYMLDEAVKLLNAGLSLRMHGDISHQPMSQKQWDANAEAFLLGL